jgi:hypothetical protein
MAKVKRIMTAKVHKIIRSKLKDWYSTAAKWKGLISTTYKQLWHRPEHLVAQGRIRSYLIVIPQTAALYGEGKDEFLQTNPWCEQCWHLIFPCHRLGIPSHEKAHLSTKSQYPFNWCLRVDIPIGIMLGMLIIPGHLSPEKEINQNRLIATRMSYSVLFF